MNEVFHFNLKMAKRRKKKKSNLSEHINLLIELIHLKVKHRHNKKKSIVPFITTVKASRRKLFFNLLQISVIK